MRVECAGWVERNSGCAPPAARLMFCHKGTLARGFDVDVVDMESAAIARVARDAGLPFAVLRVICDGPQVAAEIAAVAGQIE